MIWMLALLFVQEAPLRVSWGPPSTIDPSLAGSSSEARIVRALFEGLTTLAPDGVTVEPGMAERWESAADGRTWTFHLREARWSNGEAVKAGDFVFAWRRALRLGGPFTELFRHLRGVGPWLDLGEGRPDPEAAELGFRALDERTMVVDAAVRAPWLPHLLAFHPFVPLHAPTLAAQGRDWTRAGQITTNGPYLFDGSSLAELSLRRNPKHWDPELSKAPARISLALHTPAVALERYRAGDFAMLGAEQVPEDPAGPLPGRVDVDLWGTLFLRLNPARAPFDREAIRKALAQGIDRAALVEGTPAKARRSLVPPSFAGYPEAAGISFDRAAAMESLLRESGLDLSKLPVLELLLPDAPRFTALAGRLEAQLGKGLGLKVKAVVMKPPAYARALAAGDFAAALAGWGGDYYDPQAFLDPWAAADASTSRALLEASGLDGARRLEALAKAEEHLLRTGLLVPLSGAWESFAVAPGLTGVQANPFGHVALRRLRVK